MVRVFVRQWLRNLMHDLCCKQQGQQIEYITGINEVSSRSVIEYMEELKRRGLWHDTAQYAGDRSGQA